FRQRLQLNFGTLFPLLLQLYGRHYDFFYHLETILETAARMCLARPDELKALDAKREANPNWFQSQHMLGGVCYVDLFAGDLTAIRANIPYFKELGLTYLHLMPLFLTPEEDNDGGYAVSDYRTVNPALGTIVQLGELASELRHNGISLVLDFVFNHTSDEHRWAMQAQAGDPNFQDFYFLFPDRSMPDAYEANLREIFPNEHPGSFIYRPDIKRWVWTTFHSCQWDLNYDNPAVFTAMAEEMLFLANLGIEILRLDAVAFIWKRLGTSCENLPAAHLIIQAFNALARIAAPALLFKSEAIVHPDDVVKYIGLHECQLSYNPLLMALLWNTLATRDVRLLQSSLQQYLAIADGCSWVNYVRCHDDIGWTFSDDVAAHLGINGFDHRQFLNTFYIGQFPGSFARGLPFQFNPQTRDMRIAGTCASLAGLEKALCEETQQELELALRRIILIHSVLLSIGGIPLIYLGDELGLLNDYQYRDDPARANDSRWVHRPRVTEQDRASRVDESSIAGCLYPRLHRLMKLRKEISAFAGNATEIIDSGNEHVLAYTRCYDGRRVLVLANFTEHEQSIKFNTIRIHGLSYRFFDLVSDEPIPINDLNLAPYQFVWLQPLDA
ncbi:MAG: alpha-amylase family glycosyl hydrolase, partial [Chloroflexales bacterium]|nr:alpha-amylase family glycosyl hydrolase [Chloroflexales bacterium]